MFKNLNYITDFFKPNRQVWQEAEPHVNQSSESGPEAEAGESDDFMQVMRIIEDAKNQCEKSKKAVCSMSKDEVWNLREVNRFRKFVDELDYKFLVASEGAKKLKYTTDRFKRLGEQLDMEKITQEFLKAKSYKIITYSDRQIERSDELNSDKKLKDRIIFEYENGTKKSIDLEMVLNPPALISNRQEEVPESEESTIGDNISKYLPFTYLDDVDEDMDKTSDMLSEMYDQLFNETTEDREQERAEFDAAAQEYEKRISS